MFHELPKNAAEAEYFLERFEKNLLVPRLSQFREKITNLVETSIVTGINSLVEELHSKEQALKESTIAVTEARKRRVEITKRIKEESLKNREDLDQKLLEIKEICKKLEKEKNELVMRAQEQMLADKANDLMGQMTSLKVAKSLYCNFMKFNLKMDEDNITVSFQNANNQECLAVALDPQTHSIRGAQNKFLSIANEFERDGNVAAMILSLWKISQQKQQK